MRKELQNLIDEYSAKFVTFSENAGKIPDRLYNQIVDVFCREFSLDIKLLQRRDQFLQTAVSRQMRLVLRALKRECRLDDKALDKLTFDEALKKLLHIDISDMTEEPILQSEPSRSDSTSENSVTVSPSLLPI